MRGTERWGQAGEGHILLRGWACVSELAPPRPPALPLQMCRRPPREKTVLVGRRAVLEVTVSRSGAHVCWLREGAELCPGDKYEMRSHGSTHGLVIRNVQPEDQGTYCCQAGQESAHTLLLVEG